MRIFMQFIAALAGGAVWFMAKDALQQTFGQEAFAGHVLRSPVNAFSMATFSAVMMNVWIRYWQARREARWTGLALLPEGEEFSSFADVEPFCKLLAAQGPRRSLRPLRLLHACFESVRRNWSTAAAHHALQTKLSILQAEAETRNHVVSFLVGAIFALGFMGTLLGIGQSMGVVQSGTDAAVAELHVAFDTSLVALVLGLTATFALAGLNTREETVLNSASDKVLHDFVLRIRESDHDSRKRRLNDEE